MDDDFEAFAQEYGISIDSSSSRATVPRSPFAFSRNNVSTSAAVATFGQQHNHFGTEHFEGVQAGPIKVEGTRSGEGEMIYDDLLQDIDDLDRVGVDLGHDESHNIQGKLMQGVNSTSRTIDQEMRIYANFVE